ncbi:YidB family protein [Methylobacterium sp. NMS14P]|uniref:YidB family protein n=1 Tax=Methylobacterium sp. NMS14P TaxID=2894310 RepID=UPI00235867D3|nr:YidB family protein [Methylobacterium sp. NMS14P]WCS27557.1 YidB family protein [Methylobacterium sp. NMS14P]
MSLLNTLGGSLGQIALKALPGVIQQVLPGGLNALLDQLRRSGYESKVNSWLGRGPNEPITADDLRKVLDNEQVRQMAEKLGVPMDQLFPTLAQALPETVDRHSPDGTLQAPKS